MGLNMMEVFEEIEIDATSFREVDEDGDFVDEILNVEDDDILSIH